MSTENVSTNLRLNSSLEDLSYDKYKYTFYYIILHSLKNYFTSSILKLTIPSYRAQKPSFTSSKFITKEFGLLSQIIDNMSENSPVFMGDSAIEEKKKQYEEFMQQLKEMKEGIIELFPYVLSLLLLLFC